jgi:hypothetical protein
MSNKTNLHFLQHLIFRLRYRIYLIDTNKANKTDYQINEDEITKMKTLVEINKCENEFIKQKVIFLSQIK